MINKNELFELLAEDFAIAVKEYRRAKKESEVYDPMFMNEEEEEEKYNEYKARIKTLTTSKDYIKLTREEFWIEILKAKIQVIACIGGFKLMQEFHTFLYDYPGDNNLNLASAFDYYADGIGGWCR